MLQRHHVLPRWCSPRLGYQSAFSSKTIILILMLLSASSITQVSCQDIKVATFIDEETLERCKEDASQADEDRNLKLTTEEYLSFLNTYSYGGLDGLEKFNEMPLRFIIIYHWVACFCTFEPNADPDCCVRDYSHIPLDNSIESQETLLVLCSQTNTAIEDIFGAPTTMPSDAPSSAPSSPTLRPTLSAAPTRSLSTGVPSLDPSTTQTMSPSLGATENPTQSSRPTTISPSSSPSPPTLPPTLTSSHEPTNTPSTGVPSLNPSTIPTLSPSLGPTGNPTQSSSPPTSSFVPTGAPSYIPSYSPSAASNRPTIEGLLCINFQYTVRNEANLTADDIFYEVDNTLKSRLIIATEITLTDVLNDTFPLIARIIGSGFSASRPCVSKEPDASKVKGELPDLSHVVSVQNVNATEEKEVEDELPDLSHVVSVQKANTTEEDPFAMAWGDRRRLFSLDTLSSAVEYAAVDALGGDQNAFNLVHGELNNFLHPLRTSSYINTADTLVDHSPRRLVYYTYDYPVTIVSIADAPLLLCSGDAETETSRCAIAKTQVCVVLGPDDDPEAVRRAVVAGMSAAFGSGEFQDNIPPAPPGEAT